MIVGKVAMFNALMRCQTVVGSIVESTLKAEKMARETLHPAELYIGLELDCSGIESPSQFFNIGMPSFEALQIRGYPFANMLYSQVDHVVEIS